MFVIVVTGGDTRKDSHLVKEFELMISQDHKLRQFAEQNNYNTSQDTDPFKKQSSNNDEHTPRSPMAVADLESIADTRILDMLRMLEEYRRKCMPILIPHLTSFWLLGIKEDDDYTEARRAEDKFEKTLQKATKKQKSQIHSFQEKELKNIEGTQKQQYQEFSEAWDEYMADYEATAYLSLEVSFINSIKIWPIWSI